MKWCSGLLALVAAAVLSLALNAIAVLGQLDGGIDVSIAPLVRGDLGELFASATFWSAWPSLPPVESVPALGPIAVVLLVAGAAVAGARRWPRVPAPVWPAGALLGGLLPYALGALALRHNTVPADSGPWLAWMLVGPAAAAAMALALLVAPWRRRRPAPHKIGYAATAVS